ncbi:MAG: PAM68 family protein [Cyanobacteriota bacterium]|nr:PAM68 family protein [Cyanobacteriota bacterium]
MAENPRPRLPFEGKAKKKAPKAAPPPPGSPRRAPKTSQKPQGAIPEAVSKRMVTRMALFSGVPTGLGMLSFVAFYFIVSQDLLEIPTYVVFAVSLLCFGLGVLGLSYGVFSTAWDEEEGGSFWGWSEFKLNLGRTLSAWRAARAMEKKS